MFFQSCDTCTLCASLRSISVCTCRCTDCVKSCVLGKLLFISVRLESSSANMKPTSSRWVNRLQIAFFWVENRAGPSVECFSILHECCAVPSCRIPVPPHSEAESVLLDHRITRCIVLHQCSCEEELSLHHYSTDLSRLRLPGAPWCSSRRYGQCFRISLTQFFKLGVPSNYVLWWRYCATFHVGILAVNSPRNHCCAMNWLLAWRLPKQRKILLHVETEGFITVALSNCGVPHDVGKSCQLCPSVSCEWSFCAKVATTNCGTMMDPTCLVNVPTHRSTMTLPWLILHLRPCSMRPWLCLGHLGTLIVSIHEGSIIEVVLITFVGCWRIHTAVWWIW